MRISVLLLGLSIVAATPFVLAQEDVDQVLAMAGELQQKKDFEQATDLLRGALEAHPDDPRILLELGRTAQLQATDVLSGANPTLGRLALLDALRWYERAVEAKPDWPRALQHLGQVAVQAGEFEKAVTAYRRAVELDPADGESAYQLGYALGYLRRFAEAVKAYEKAEQLLGPDPRILLNRGICYDSLGNATAAETAFATLVRAEIEAKRPGSYYARRGFDWLWRIHSRAGAFDQAEAAFSSLAAEYPEVTAGHWYLGHARMERGNAAGAAEAFAKVTELVPDFAAGWDKLAQALVGAGKYAEAVGALEKELELDPAGQAPRETLMTIATRMGAAGKRGEAIALLTRMEGRFPNDPLLLEGRADLLFREGRMADAIADYRAARVLDPFADEIEIKAQKAASALLREGETLKDGTPLRPEVRPEPPAGTGGTILGFEGSEAYARANGAATGRREDGAFVLRRTGEPGIQANLTILLIPTLDTRAFTKLRFDVKGPKDEGLLVRAKDCYDQFEVTPFFVRILHRDPVKLTGDWQTVELGLDGFRSAVENRPLPLNRARLRGIIFEIGLGLVPDLALAKEVRIDNVMLVAGDGGTKPIADFDAEPSETVFVSDGAATAFAPTLFSPEQLATFRPDPNTYVSPSILGKEYDAKLVHSGEGSFRMTLPREGAASGSLTFNPDRSYDKATALVFWARGEDGEEKVRVTIEDALDLELANPAPAAAPRLMAAGTLVEGHFVLTREWKRFRIPRSAFPDVDFRSLTRIRWHFGTDQGNEVGATWYLDDVGWE